MADGHTSPTSFSTEALLNDNRPFLNEAEAIVAARRAKHIGGVSWAGMTTPIDDVETVRLRLVDLDARAEAFRASPLGKARIAVSKAWRIAELNRLIEVGAALDALSAALHREPATAEPFADAVLDVIATLPHGDVRDALSLLGTEVVLNVREIG